MQSKLILIVITQLFCTSVWFAANAVFPDIIADKNLTDSFLADITSAIQTGFIFGTLTFALLAISDRFSPSIVFCLSAVLAAFFNLAVIWESITPSGLLLSRFMTGFFLAGIYPVGMKIASDYIKDGLGLSLGFLVGATVFSKSLPHLLKFFTAQWNWEWVIYTTSGLTFAGGILLFLFVPDGPHRRKGQVIKWHAFLSGFKNQSFRKAAFGYFGHMWELYSFWAFLPLMIKTYKDQFRFDNVNIPLYTSIIIAAGGLSCMLGGLLTKRYSSKKIATLMLSVSCGCCLLSPIFMSQPFLFIFIIFLFIWGFAVVGDSPQLSTLVAQYAPQETRGTSLTIVNCIGFSLTIVSLQVLEIMSALIPSAFLYSILGIGPIFGLLALKTKKVIQ